MTETLQLHHLPYCLRIFVVVLQCFKKDLKKLYAYIVNVNEIKIWNLWNLNRIAMRNSTFIRSR